MRIYLNLFAFAGFLLMNVCSYGQSVRDSSKPKILTTLNAFYKAYVNEMSNADVPNEKKLNEIKKKYCTLSLLNKLAKQELDYDPFLNAQDADVSILESILLKKTTRKAASLLFLMLTVIVKGRQLST